MAEDTDEPPYQIVEDKSPDEPAGELPTEIMPEPIGPDNQSMLITPERRQEFLGKLAEFEMMLLALPVNQQNFVLLMLRDPSNASNNVRAAGYSPKSAHVMASKLLATARIAALIALGNQIREDRTLITSDRTLNELAIIAFSNIGDYVAAPGSHEVRTKPGVPEYALRAIQSADFTTTITEGDDSTTTTYKTKIKLWPKVDALRMLAQYQKLLQAGGDVNVSVHNDNRGQVHNYKSNRWQIGDKMLEF